MGKMSKLAVHPCLHIITKTTHTNNWQNWQFPCLPIRNQEWAGWSIRKTSLFCSSIVEVFSKSPCDMHILLWRKKNFMKRIPTPPVPVTAKERRSQNNSVIAPGQRRPFLVYPARQIAPGTELNGGGPCTGPSVGTVNNRKSVLTLKVIRPKVCESESSNHRRKKSNKHVLSCSVVCGVEAWNFLLSSGMSAVDHPGTMHENHMKRMERYMSRPENLGLFRCLDVYTRTGKWLVCCSPSGNILNITWENTEELEMCSGCCVWPRGGRDNFICSPTFYHQIWSGC